MTATIHCAGCQHAYIETALFCPNCGRPKVRDASADPLLGKVLGDRFLVQELLGQGRSGTIYRAEHVTLRRRVAIKVLHTELSRDDLAVERFRREATTVAEIDNEHIVEIHDFGRTPDARLYLAMELLEGETLDTVLARDKQLSIERAADILIQLGEALMEAHAIGYVHRDLRPRNIYLSVRRGKANFIKLLDFGLAKLVETEGQAASTSLGMTFGDPRYMSPEQARGDRIDRRADIYQLGCVAYEMLTGAPPFSGSRVFDILTRQVTEAPQPLPTLRPGVPLWMEAAVTKMLAKDPDNRFATTSRMVEALRRGLETGEVMEDDVARRRESIPPPSVSRVMQRMGLPVSPETEPALAAPAAPAATAAPAAAGPTPAAPVAPAVPAAPASRAPAAPAAASPARPAPAAAPVPAAPAASAPVAPAVPPPVVAAPAAVVPPVVPPVDPSVTMRTPVAPPPAKPDSVELLRKRTGTPQLGVPVMHAAGQVSVAGVIVPPAPAPAAAARPGARESAAPSADPPPTSAADAATSSKRAGPGASDLAISQVWYDEGDRLSAGEEEPSARVARARKTISPSATDLSFYDERPRRRWGLFAGVGAFVVVGATVAFALTYGRTPHESSASLASGTSGTSGTSGASGAPGIAAVSGGSPGASAPAVPADAAPSTILPAEPPAAAPEVAQATPDRAADRPAADPPAAAADRLAAKPVAAVPPPARPRSHHATEAHAAAEPRASARRPAEPAGGSLALDTEPRRPSGPSPAPATERVPSLTDNPKDPYGGDEPPSDGVSPERKAEFFANLGSQQLAGGDTAGAAANFKKALEIDARNVNAMLGMGEIALRQGLFGDAIAHLGKAAKLAPKSSRVLTLLGEAYLSSGNNAQAAANFKKALQLDPDNARARDGYNEASSRVPPPEDD
ncbi:MAG TPA: protein kinase [Kofleriaceae bacterium]|nr:protein kinase [Kofleriaceae bacterium]